MMSGPVVTQVNGTFTQSGLLLRLMVKSCCLSEPQWIPVNVHNQAVADTYKAIPYLAIIAKCLPVYGRAVTAKMDHKARPQKQRMGCPQRVIKF